MGLLNIALRFVGFGDVFAGLAGNTVFITGTSNTGGAGRLSSLAAVANGDSLMSFILVITSASASAVPGGGGLFVSNGAILSTVLCGILNPLSDTKYSPD